MAVALALGACSPAPDGTPGAASPSDRGGPSAGVLPSSAPPVPGTEVYGFVPYWEMDDTIAAHVAGTPLTTLALFSVTTTNKGAVDTSQNGYARITGDVGRRLIAEAHDRGTRVELVFSSFGTSRNKKLFGSPKLQDAAIASLTALAADLGVDGIAVDVESLDPDLVPAYGAFVGRLRDALVAVDGGSRVTVATTANPLGAAMAEVAVEAGADRVFVMAYDYRTGSSEPGATSPLARADGGIKDLPWSLDVYQALGVPRERTLLGLPLYGVTWPVAGPVVGAPQVGKGEAWILRQHLDVLLDASIVPVRDSVESVEVYLFGSDGSTGAPSFDPSATAPAFLGSATPAPPDVTWRAVYVDSPATLATKMDLATQRGLVGVGFWAIGYERGLPGYTDLMVRFSQGKPLP